MGKHKGTRPFRPPWLKSSFSDHFKGFVKLFYFKCHTQRRTTVKLMSFHFKRKLLLIEWQKPATLGLCMLENPRCFLCVTKREHGRVQEPMVCTRHDEWSPVLLRSQVLETLGSQPESSSRKQKLHLNLCCLNAVYLLSSRSSHEANTCTPETLTLKCPHQ